MSEDVVLRVVVKRRSADYRSVILGSFTNAGGWSFFGVAGLVAGGAVFFPGVARQSPSVLIDSAGAAALVALLGSAVWLAALLTNAWRVSRLPAALDPVSYAFSHSGVEVVSSVGQAFTKWDAWKKAVETRTLIVLLSKAGIAHVLPKRDLTSDEQMRLRILLNDALGGSARVFVEYSA